MIIVDLSDRATALHLAVALRVHAATCRRDGTHVPPALEELRARCWSIAAQGADRGQGGPTLAELAEGMQRGPVPLLTYAQAADLLAVSVRSIKRLVAHGALPSVRVGDGSIRIRRTDLDEYVASLRPRSFRERTEHKAAAS